MLIIMLALNYNKYKYFILIEWELLMREPFRIPTLYV